MSRSGKAVALEGIDFAGKTTQAGRLRSWLESTGKRVASFNFPDRTTRIGALLDAALERKLQLTPAALFMLFAANRLERQAEILTALESCDIVIFDRYSESEYAYGTARSLPKSWLVGLEALAYPADLVVVLDVDPNKVGDRMMARGRLDVFEEDRAFIGRVRTAYVDLVADPPRPGQVWERIDGLKGVEEVHAMVRALVSRHLLVGKE